jgi:hypothetical protein
MNDTLRSFLNDNLVRFNTSSAMTLELISNISLSRLLILRPMICLRMPNTPTIFIVRIVGLGKEGSDR